MPVLTALDRAGGVAEAVLDNRGQIAAALDQRIERGSGLGADGAKPHVSAAQRARSEPRRIEPPRQDWVKRAVGGKPRKPGRMRLGRVNAHHARGKTVIPREARGVSTKTRALHRGWHRAIRRPGFNPTTLLTTLLIHS